RTADTNFPLRFCDLPVERFLYLTKFLLQPLQFILCRFGCRQDLGLLVVDGTPQLLERLAGERRELVVPSCHIVATAFECLSVLGRQNSGDFFLERFNTLNWCDRRR